MIRRPRKCALFPYTTLFRSHAARRARCDPRVDLLMDLNRLTQKSQQAIAAAQDAATRAGHVEVDSLHLDRKSTRLNSSHPSMSYAVFCLKKTNTPHDALTSG